MLQEKIAEACGISEQEAQEELECATENLYADALNGELDYDSLEEEMAGLGLEMDDDNLDAMLMRLMCGM